METATVDGITSTSASESVEEITSALSHDDSATVEAPAAPETPASATSAAKPAKKGSYQARIDELTAELANARQSTTTLNSRLQEVEGLKAEIAALKQAYAKPAPQERQPERPAEDAKPVESDFESYADFVDARAAWVVRQERKKWDAEQSQRQQHETRQQHEARISQEFQTRLEAAKTTIPNFDAVLASNLPLSRPMQDVIRASEIGPQLMAHLHNNPEEHARIYGAGAPLEVFRQMNKLEARLEAAVDSGPAPKAKPISQAKPPIKPLGAASTAVSDGPPGDDASYEEHERYWNRIEAEKAKQGRS